VKISISNFVQIDYGKYCQYEMSISSS